MYNENTVISNVRVELAKQRYKQVFSKVRKGVIVWYVYGLYHLTYSLWESGSEISSPPLIQHLSDYSMVDLRSSLRHVGGCWTSDRMKGVFRRWYFIDLIRNEDKCELTMFGSDGAGVTPPTWPWIRVGYDIFILPLSEVTEVKYYWNFSF